MQSSLQSDGACLRYPEQLGTHPNLAIDTILNMLTRAISLSQQVPFAWGYIDKPQDGQVHLLYMPNPSLFPNDGIRWQDGETKLVTAAGPGREIEVCEIKYGFIPSSGDQVASRVRRRYRLIRGGLPALSLVHYTRGPPMPINPMHQNQPCRAYPLRPLNEPNVYVAGEKMGQKVYPQGAPVPQPGVGVNYAGGITIPPGTNPQALLSQQRARMEGLDARSQRDGNAAAANAARAAAQPPVRMEEEDSGDEGDQISTRALALSRYRRNHELMNEVFMYAAFGEKNAPPRPPSYSTLFNKSELDDKMAKLTAEIEELQAKERVSRPEAPFEGDISMESIHVG